LAEARDLAEIDAALAAEVGIVEGAAQGVAANDAVDDATGVNSDADVAEVDADDVPDAESDVDVALTDADGVTASDTDIAVVDGVSDAESRIDDVAAEVGDRADTGIGVDDVDIVVSDGSNGAEHSELSIADVANEAEDSEGKQPAAVESEDLAVLAAGLMRGSSDVQSGLTSLVDNFIDEREQDESAASSASQEAVEISAHDIVAEAWEPQPESTSNTDTPNVEFASADESKVDGVVNESDIFDEPTGPTESEDSSHPEGGNDSLNSGAQTQLRHVIEEFADEHQQQIDAQNLQLQQTVITKDSAHQPLSSKDASSDLASLEVETSTTGPTENQQGDLSTAHQKPTLYGLSGKIESELSDNELDRQHDKATDSRDAEP